MTKVKTYEAGYTSGRERVERRDRQEGKKGTREAARVKDRLVGGGSEWRKRKKQLFTGIPVRI